MWESPQQLGWGDLWFFIQNIFEKFFQKKIQKIFQKKIQKYF